MLTKAYIINFDKSGLYDDFDYQKFKVNLTSAKGLISWWHYLESSYIIVTDSTISATSITHFVKKHMEFKHFLVVELNLKNHDGWLPQEAWEWIHKHI